MSFTSNKAAKARGEYARRQRRQKRARGARLMQPSLERLENRCLLSVTFLGTNSNYVPANNADIPPQPGIGQPSPIEPQITVNASNPSEIAFSDQNVLNVSTNAGGSFQPLQFFPLGSSGGDTSTVYDAQGNLYWENLDGSKNLAPTIVQVNPVTGAFIGTPHAIDAPPVVGGIQTSDDKGFLTTDGTNLFVGFDRFSTPTGGISTVMLSRSTDQGVHWSAPVTVSGAGEGYVWPSSVSVGPDGSVYVGYHSEPSGTATGQVLVARYSNDLSQVYSKTAAFAPGAAARRVSYPGESFPATPNGGSIGVAGPTVLADPARPGNVYVFSINDPSGGGAGDAANLVFAHSTDYGQHWTTSTLESGPNNSLQLLPRAAINRQGDLVVTWYDTRNGGTSSTSSNSLLDVYAKYSLDGGGSWSPAFQVNDSNNRFDPGASRMPDYIGIDVSGGTAYVAWAGNTWSATNANGTPAAGATVTGSQPWMDSFAMNGSLIVNEDSSLGNSIVISAVPGNPSFVQVSVNLQVEYTGLASGLNGITINEGAAVDTVNIENEFGIPIQVSMGSGRDAVNIGTNGFGGDENFRADVQGTVNITRGSGYDTLNVYDQNGQDQGRIWTLTGSGLFLNGLGGGAVTYNGLDAVALAGGSAAAYDVEGTSAPTIVDAGYGSVNVAPQSQNLDGIVGALAINGNGATPLFVNDQNNPNFIAPTQDTMTSTTLTRTAFTFNPFLGVVPRSATITYAGLSSLQLATGALPNTVWVKSTAVPTTVNAGAGNGLVDVSDQAENLDDLPAALTVNGDGTDALVVNDQNNPNSYVPTQDTITSTTLARVAFGTSIPGIGIPGPHNASINYSTLGSLQLNAGALPNIIHVESTSAATTVNAGAGNALVDVSPQAENLDNLPASLAVNGNGTDSLVVYDQNNPNFFQPTQDTITSTAVTRVGFDLIGVNNDGPIIVPRVASITYGGLGYVVLDTGALANVVYVESTWASTTINAGAGNLLVDVSDQAENLDNIPASLTVNGNGSDALVVNDQNNPNVVQPTQDIVTSTNLTRVAFALTFVNGIPNVIPHIASITYGGLGSLELDTGAASNYVDIESTAAPTTIGAGAGNFLVDVSDQAENLDSIQGALTVNGTPSLVVNDQLRPAAATYTVAAATITRTGAAPISYANTGNLALYGGAASDTFTVASPLSATAVSIGGGGGTNTLDGPNTANTWTMTGPNSGTLGALAFANFQNLVGGAGSDTLTAANTTNAWTLTAAGAGSVDGLAFLSMEHLVGGTGDDTLTGPNSTNAWHLTGPNAGFLGTASTMTFAAVEHLVGGTGFDSLAGSNATNAWNLTGPNSGTLGPLTFAAIEEIIGGTGSDTLTGANIANAWTLNTSNAGTVDGLLFVTMGHLVGGTASDSLADPNVNSAWNLTGPNSGTVGAVTFAGMEQLIGSTGSTLTGPNTTNAWTMTGVKAGSVDGLAFSAMDHLVGGTGDDTLTGPNTANAWKLTGPNAGTLGTMTFAAIEHLVGGTGTDTLTGLNTTNAWTLTGTNAGTLGTLTFAAMESLFGGTGTDTLTGPNLANTWLISAVNAGKIGTLSFKSMESVAGGTAVDTFEFSGSGSVASLNGGGAPAGTADWLDYSRLLATVPVTVNLATHSATRVANPISNIENVRGGKGPNTLTGDSVGNILIGGAGNDVIVGGTGKSLLIGDKGADSITGHSANDILIGDYTSYDASTAANNTALMAILNEWKSADSYATRFAEINGGTIAGHSGVKLNYGTTVKNDSAADTVTGSALATAHDWYFASTGDTTTNLHAGEYLNNAIH